MSEIIKTEAVVIRKLDYGDTSKIITLFSEKHGKIKGIIKGARSPRSKIGASADLLNLVNIVFYSKESREIQLISQVDLISNFTNLKSQLDPLKYGTAVVELFDQLTIEDEAHPKLFSGLKRILELIDSVKYDPQFLFAKFLLFFIKEIGYEVQFNKCSQCGKDLSQFAGGGYNFGEGIFCEGCLPENLISFTFNQELLETLLCLNLRNNELSVRKKTLAQIIFFLEKFLMFHIPEFKGIKSLQLY